MSENVFNGNGVEILLPDSESFLKIKETLTRIGILSKKDNILYQSCHILHKKGYYAILHFKELFVLDGKNATLSDNDIGRRNTIVSLLQDWGLLTIVEPDFDSSPMVSINQIKILSYKEKSNYQLVEKYSIGKNKYH
jgi:hypothetical protein